MINQRNLTRWRASIARFAEKCKHYAVELLGPLQRCEVTYAREIDKFCIWNAPSEIFGVFALDEFIMLALDDRDGHADLRQIVRRIIGLRSLHEADRLGKLVELIRRGRQLGVVLACAG